MPETLEQRYDRVSREQKRTLVVRADDFRCDERGVYDHGGDMGVIAWRMAERVFRELLPAVDEVRALVGAPGAGKTTWLELCGVRGVLYLDTTLSRRLSRRQVCMAALAADRVIDCVFIDTELEVCLARNRKRSPSRRVPDDRVRDAHHRLVLCPPDVDEGWRRVLHVSGGPDLTWVLL